MTTDAAAPSPTHTRADTRHLITEIIWSRAYNRDHTKVRQAELIADAITHALRREGLITGTSPANAAEIINTYATRFKEPPIRGISHLVAQALVLINLPTVHRDTLRALMPQAKTRATKTTVGMQFNRALRKFSSWRWITRSDDGLIGVEDVEALANWFTIAVDATNDRAATTLDLARAITHLHDTIAAGDADELRRQELMALHRLMQTAPGAITRERGRVRVTPKSNPL